MRALLLWLILVLLALFAARDLGKLLYGSVGVLPDSKAAHTEARLARDFDGAFAQFVLVVLQGPKEGPEAEAERPLAQAVARLKPLLAQQPYVSDVLVMPEGSPRHAVLVLGLREARLKGSERHVAPLRALLRESLPPGGLVQPLLTGQAPFSLDLVSMASAEAGQTEAKVLPFTLVALLLSFGALGAAFLPLVSGVAAVLCSLGLLSLVARLQDTTVYATNIISMLGLGLGIDYALFLVARIREEGQKGLPHREAVFAATRHAAGAIAISAGTVCLGLLGLATAPGMESVGLGIGGILVGICSALTAIGLLPVLALLAGPWLNAPKALSARFLARGPSPRWAQMAEAVLRRPWQALALSLALLLPLAWPLHSLALGDPDPALLPPKLESVQGVQALRGIGQGGSLIPFRLLVASEDGGPILSPGRLGDLARMAADLKAEAPVGQVLALVEPSRVQRLAVSLALLGEAGLRAKLPAEARPLISRDGRSVVLTVVLKADQGLSEARAFASQLQSSDWAKRYPKLKAQVHLAGAAVQSQEFVDAAHQVYPRVLGIMAVATLLMMGLMTRSVVLALKAMLANALTVAAALGATWWLIQNPTASAWLGLAMPATTVPSGIPLLACCVVFGLSMDYEVFLLSRVQEAHREGLSDREAIVRAVSQSGGVITTAAIIMGMVFLGFALTPFFPIKVLGLALMLGVLLDATVVRLLLVPSLMTLMGGWNWWPGDRWHPLTKGPDVATPPSASPHSGRMPL